MTASAERTHTILVDNRKKVTITGITDVGCFNDQSVELATDFGCVKIKGRELHIKKISVESGDIQLEGSIDCIEYNQKLIGKNSSGGLFKKIFR